ncbi:hypothetical protein K443DRAFT_367540 [Laccaria amethystina LaAM-08-1]|uniref:Uncharacterized protein n=1 Tax=Laccaria amethystina LaAM-08-1 TaxID=1095629 RepID=A0A0C9XJH3_9AGAR|nr:hypothetical protein K443DRAFT_367540 [Laccaria amethystina LaAM-08-1]
MGQFLELAVVIRDSPGYIQLNYLFWWTLYSEVKYISNYFDVGPQLSTFTSLTTRVPKLVQRHL